MRQEKFIVELILLRVDVPAKYLEKILNSLFLHVALLKQIYNFLDRNVPVIVCCNQSESISNISQIVFRIANFESLHKLFKVDFIVYIKYFCTKFTEMLRRYVIPHSFKYVLQVFLVYFTVLCIHIKNF